MSKKRNIKIKVSFNLNATRPTGMEDVTELEEIIVGLFAVTCTRKPYCSWTDRGDYSTLMLLFKYPITLRSTLVAQREKQFIFFSFNDCANFCYHSNLQLLFGDFC